MHVKLRLRGKRPIPFVWFNFSCSVYLHLGRVGMGWSLLSFLFLSSLHFQHWLMKKSCAHAVCPWRSDNLHIETCFCRRVAKKGEIKIEWDENQNQTKEETFRDQTSPHFWGGFTHLLCQQQRRRPPTIKTTAPPTPKQAAKTTAEEEEEEEFTPAGVPQIMVFDVLGTSVESNVVGELEVKTVGIAVTEVVGLGAVVSGTRNTLGCELFLTIWVIDEHACWPTEYPFIS